jgi:hypothetical protein
VLPVDPTVRHTNPIHTYLSYFINIKYTMILPSTPRSSKLSLPFIFRVINPRKACGVDWVDEICISNVAGKPEEVI